MIPSFLLQKEQIQFENRPVHNQLSFIDKTAKGIARLTLTSMQRWQVSQKNGLLQSIDGRVKVAFLLCFVILINFIHFILPQLGLSVMLFILFALSRLNLTDSYKKIAFIGFIFGFLLFIPSSLNIVTKGRTLFTLITFEKESSWWIYKLPSEISVTYEGIQLVARLTLKVINSVSVVVLIVSTTTFEQIVKSLSFFKVPDIFILTVTLSYKFIFILSQTIEETYQALKMRWWNRGKVNNAEEIVAGRIGYLFRKSWERYELVYQSMIARGYNGSANFCYFDRLKRQDYVFSSIFLVIIASIIILNFFYV